MEKIKRANSLWTNDSIFLRKTLNIPIESDQSPTLTDNSFELDIESRSGMATGNSPECGSVHSNAEVIDIRLLPDHQRPVQDSTSNGKTVDSNHHSRHDSNGATGDYTSIELQAESNEDHRSNAESANNGKTTVNTAKSFLSRVDELIARSKDQMDTLSETGSEICKSVSEHDLFRVKTHLARRQHSMHVESSLNRISASSNGSQDIRDGVFSFRQLEQQQQDELFEL